MAQIRLLRPGRQYTLAHSANASAGELLNDIFKIKGNIKFGNWYESISSITGLIYINVKNIKLRHILNFVLGKNHCENAITKLQEKYYKI